MDALQQSHCYFGIIEIICEAHDVPRGVTPKYTITCDGDTGSHEPHMIIPPRYIFFLNPGEYTVKCQFLGVVAEDINLMVNTGDASRVKYHFHGKWSEGLPKPPQAQKRKPPQVVQQPQVMYAPPPAYAPQPAAAAAGSPTSPPSAFPTPGQPPTQPMHAAPMPQVPAAAQQGPPKPVAPAQQLGTSGHLGTGMHGVSSSIAPPPMPVTSHMVAPPPPPGGRPATPPPGGPGYPQTPPR